MLRRVKSDVENEMGEKVEKDVFCELSPRQKRLYRGIKDKLPILDLLATGSSQSNSKFNFRFGIGGGDSLLLLPRHRLIQLWWIWWCNSGKFVIILNYWKKLKYWALSISLCPERLRLGNIPSNNGMIYTNPTAIEFRLPKRVIEEIPIGKKREFYLNLQMI